MHTQAVSSLELWERASSVFPFCELRALLIIEITFHLLIVLLGCLIYGFGFAIFVVSSLWWFVGVGVLSMIGASLWCCKCCAPTTTLCAAFSLVLTAGILSLVLYAYFLVAFVILAAITEGFAVSSRSFDVTEEPFPTPISLLTNGTVERMLEGYIIALYPSSTAGTYSTLPIAGGTAGGALAREMTYDDSESAELGRFGPLMDVTWLHGVYIYGGCIVGLPVLAILRIVLSSMAFCKKNSVVAATTIGGGDGGGGGTSGAVSVTRGTVVSVVPQPSAASATSVAEGSVRGASKASSTIAVSQV